MNLTRMVEMQQGLISVNLEIWTWIPPDLNQNKNAVNVPDVEVKKITKHKLKNNTRCVNMSNM